MIETILSKQLIKLSADRVEKIIDLVTTIVFTQKGKVFYIETANGSGSIVLQLFSW